MTTSSAQMRTLASALKGSGSEQVLAKSLGVSLEDLGRWLRGQDTVPANVYCKVLGLVGGKRR